eukprot:1186630-Prorocentrum_minimum.AAC.4
MSGGHPRQTGVFWWTSVRPVANKQNSPLTRKSLSTPRSQKSLSPEKPKVSQPQETKSLSTPRNQKSLSPKKPKVSQPQEAKSLSNPRNQKSLYPKKAKVSSPPAALNANMLMTDQSDAGSVDRPGGAERSFRRRAAGAPREAAGGADAGTGDDARVRGPAAAAGVELKQTRGRCAAR